MKNFVQSQLGLESIEFQNSSFRKELMLAFEELQNTKKADIPESDIVQRVSAVITHHTGLNVTINVGKYDPSVEIPAVNKNNPLINSFIREYVSSADGLKMIANAKNACRGAVNLKTGMVSGVFTEVKSTINLPLTMFISDKFTPGEIAAITLHEVGHLFTYYEFMSRTVTTNQCLAGMSKALDGSSSVADREMILVNVKKALNLTELDAKELAKTRNDKVVEIVVISNVVKTVESEIGTNVYDFSTWEYLADQYAARQGASRDLVTALEKYYRGSWNISFRSLPAYLAMEALKLASLFVLPGIAMLFIVYDGRGDKTYDQPGARLKRIRSQIVENLKNKDITKEDFTALNNDLDAIDNILRDVNDRRQLFGVVWDTLAPSARRALDQERLQQQLEAIAANDLFVKAAELKQLA